MITILTVVGAVLLVLLAAFISMTWAVNADANRQDRIDSAPPVADDPAAFLRALHGAADEPARTGNDVQLLQNGDEIFPAMIDAIRQARETVHFGTYVYWAGTIPDQFAALLCETARRGVRVRLVVDGKGARPMDPALTQRMRDAGCEVGIYRPARWSNLFRYNHRSHRRLLVVDGTIGFTGGVGIGDEWSGHAQSPSHWRDTHARITGPAVASLQAAFADAWNRCNDELLLNARDYPALSHTGAVDACVVVSAPSAGASAAQRTMAACIAGATRSLHITNAYFVPTPAFVQNLCEASRRGVDVKVIVPGEHIDVGIVRCASRHVWTPLLDAGVEIHEYQPTMLHCKTLVVDGAVSLIGSINFDPRSFTLNSESAIVAADPGLGAEMERVFTDDLARARRVDRDTFRARARLGRVRDALAYWVRAQL